MNENRALASLEKKLSKSVGHRVDVELADTRKINKTTAHFLLSYATDVPNSEEISRFFVRKFDAKVVPFMSTAKIYKGRKVISLVAQLLNVTRDVEDIKKRRMTPVIAGAVYLDVPLQETWEISERNGKKVLCRKVKDDIMSLVQARRNSMMDSAKTITFASVTDSSLITWLHAPEKGDKVRVLIGDKVVDAEVMAASENEVTVKHKSGTDTIEKESILEIVSKSEKTKEEMEKEQYEYFKDAYGDEEFAKELVY